MQTIAFSPPGKCAQLSTFEGAGASKGDLAVETCGVLMTLLEEGAAQRNYRVVTWRNLLGNKRPVDFARDAGVDALVEVNEVIVTEDRVRPGAIVDFRVFEQHGDKRFSKRVEKFEQRPDLPFQCRNQIPAPLTVNAFGIDAKLITVDDGVVRATYRNKALIPMDDLLEEDEKTDDLVALGNYPTVAGTAELPNADKHNGLVRGAALAGTGVAVCGVGAGVSGHLYNAGYADYSQGFVAVPLALAGVVGGIFALTGACTLWGAWNLEDMTKFDIKTEGLYNICTDKMKTLNGKPGEESTKMALRSLARDLLDSILPGSAGYVPPAPASPPARSAFDAPAAPAPAPRSVFEVPPVAPAPSPPPRSVFDAPSPPIAPAAAPTAPPPSTRRPTTYDECRAQNGQWGVARANECQLP